MLTSKNQKHFMTLATLVTPFCKKSIGRFCQWFSTDNINGLKDTKTMVKVKFGDNEAVNLSENFFITTDRKKFDYENWPSKLKDQRTDFVYLGADLEGDGRGFWNVVLARDKLNKIEKNVKNGTRIQIFTISFDGSLQRDPNLTISSNVQQDPSLLFRSSSESLLGLGIIENQNAMSVEEYKEITGDDPFLQFAKQNYDDATYQADHSKPVTFDDFLEQQKNRFI